MINVIELNVEMELAYAEFISSDDSGMIYGTLAFRDFLQNAVGGTPHYLLAMNAGKIVGVLPLFETVHPICGKVFNSLPWYGTHGGCIVADDFAAAAREALLNAYADLLMCADVAFSTLILSPDENALRHEYVKLLRPVAIDDRIGQITDLPQDGADLEMRLESIFAQKTRNLSRKSRKQGFELALDDSSEAWKFLYETHVANMQAIGGMAKPWSHFVSMQEAIPQASRQLLTAKLDGEPVAALLLLRFNRTVEYLTPVIRHEFRAQQPLSFLIWHGMVDAIQSGFRRWNWGGTWVTQKSLHHFKAGWGARDCPYSYLIHAKPSAIEALRADRKGVADAYPFYFTYPFGLLEEPASAVI